VVGASSVQHGDLDRIFGRMRRAGLSHSRMNNARALLRGTYKWGKRDRKVSANPVDRFELPKSVQSKKPAKTPELGDLLRLLDGADAHDPCLAPVLKLGATTGMRRGELAGLRRDRLRLDRRELDVDTAINDAGGVVVEKRTKPQRDRVVSIDDATVTMLRAHLADMDHRARLCGTTVATNAFVFSLDPACLLPMRPEFMTRRMRVLRAKLGIEAGDFDATILALRKWTSSELMDAGFNPSAVSDRQGHTVQTMLDHYSSRRRSADRAAADHLGAQVHGQPPRSSPNDDAV
jgi:integrase